MALVRVFGNHYVNPAHVGAAELDIKFDSEKRTRTNTTTVYDATRQNVLCEAVTTISQDGPVLDTRVDNALHKEIVTSIDELRHARSYEELRALCESQDDCETVS